MVTINFDVALFYAMKSSEASEDAAARVLVIASEYIRRGEAMPQRLAEFIAGAIEAAMLRNGYEITSRF